MRGIVNFAKDNLQSKNCGILERLNIVPSEVLDFHITYIMLSNVNFSAILSLDSSHAVRGY